MSKTIKTSSVCCNHQVSICWWSGNAWCPYTI